MEYENRDDSQNIWVIVVTFNRKELLLKCLEAINSQTCKTRKILIIDNASTDGTPQRLFDEGLITECPPDNLDGIWKREFEVTKGNWSGKRILYVRMQTNTGGSGGFYEGIKTAYESGADWLWMMDDDGIPDINCLSELFNVGQKGFDYIAPNLLDENGESHFFRYFSKAKTDIINFKGGPFNGILLSRKLVKATGYPMKNFFLWGDENEYTERMYNRGFPLVTLEKAIHNHKRTAINFKTCNRGFYIIRNNFYRYRLLEGVFLSKKILLIILSYKSLIVVISFFVNLNIKQFFMCIYGFIKGCTSSLSKYQKECKWWGID